MKKIFMIMLALLLCMVLFPGSVSATIDLSAEQDINISSGIETFTTPVTTQTVYSGGCGDDGKTSTASNVTWSLDTSTGVLTISGSGNIIDYANSTSQPYYAYKSIITNVIIESGVTGIGKYAFYSYTGLTSLTIGEGVTSIGDFAFCNCSNLDSIMIPSSVTYIGGYAFKNTPWLNTQKNEASNGMVVINHILIDGTAATGAITIPSDVSSISNRAFLSCSNITSLTISDSVTSIGEYAFSGCSGLVSLTLGKSIATIGASAFDGLTQLTAIHWNAVDVTNITHTSNVFNNCGTAGTGITVTFGDSVTSIPSCAFWTSNSSAYSPKIISLSIGNSVTSIGINAFNNCTELTELTIPDSVTTIGADAFRDCTGLTSIQWNAINVTDFIYSSDVFYNCGIDDTGITVTFGDSVTSIPAYAFYMANPDYSPKIISLIIGNNVTSIGDFAFCNCSNIDSITIPSSVTSIGGYAFQNTPWLNTQKNEASNGMVVINHILIDGTAATGAITIPSDVSSISNRAFLSCSNITSLTISDSVTSIGEYAFSGCSGLVSLTLGKSIATIGASAFDGLTQLTAIHWNSTNAKTNNNSGIFSSVGSATSGITLIFGDNVESIPDYAFYGSTTTKAPNLKSPITISKNIETIGDYAFYNCYKITSLTLSDKVTTIGDYAFSGLSNLQSITIPFATTSIGPYTFKDRNSNFTIYGYNDSYAEDYASLYGINFSSLGDVAFPITYMDDTTTLSLTPTEYIYHTGLTALPAPTKDGYSFAGWYDNHDLIGDPITSISNSQTGSVTMYSKWTPVNKITVNAGNGGSISPGTTTIGYGTSQTFTITPSSGYQIQDVTVDGISKGTVTSYTFNNVTANHTISATFKQKITQTFTDVPNNIWYKDYVNDLVSKGILNGYKNSDNSYSFKPDKSITRAEFATILAKASGDDLSGYENKTSFSDVSISFWGAKYIEWAYKNGIVNGMGNGIYDPNANISRQEMAVMIYRFATTYKGGTLPQKNAALSFTDQNDIATWATEAVSAMQQAGIINGVENSDGSFRFEPKSNATRAQAAKMISEYLGL